MDFEEQLEKAEKLTSPSLVGASMRSADDSAHQNYIHPEKSSSNSRPAKRLILNLSIGASLDDLINEGALLGLEENFERFLDDKGIVKDHARYLAQEDEPPRQSPLKDGVAAAEAEEAAEISEETGIPASEASADVKPVKLDVENIEAKYEASEGQATPSQPLIYGSENYSTPNLSEYQLDQQISDHSSLLNLVKLYDLSKLPSSSHQSYAEGHAASERVPKSVRASARRNQAFEAKPDDARVTDSLHTPYFPRDERLPSRSRVAARSRSRSSSRSRSVNKPHLARGDSYKSTHDSSPAKYELPAGLAVEEEEDEATDRRSRQARPTMGDLIAAAEAEAEFRSTSITRDPSLVTSGDYTNFNADAPSERMADMSLYLVRSQALTNYLRSILRSRSRQPERKFVEKNDANPEELAKEGALVSDDPYDQMSGLDAMVDKVLKKTTDELAETDVKESSSPVTSDKAPSAANKNVGSKSSEYVENEMQATEEEMVQEQVDVLAEEKIHEAHEQLVAEEAPLVKADDINMDAVRASEDGKNLAVGQVAETLKSRERVSELVGESLETASTVDKKLEKGIKSEVSEKKFLKLAEDQSEKTTEPSESKETQSKVAEPEEPENLVKTLVISKPETSEKLVKSLEVSEPKVIESESSEKVEKSVKISEPEIAKSKASEKREESPEVPETGVSEYEASEEITKSPEVSKPDSQQAIANTTASEESDVLEKVSIKSLGVSGAGESEPVGSKENISMKESEESSEPDEIVKPAKASDESDDVSKATMKEPESKDDDAEAAEIKTEHTLDPEANHKIQDAAKNPEDTEAEEESLKKTVSKTLSKSLTDPVDESAEETAPLKIVSKKAETSKEEVDVPQEKDSPAQSTVTPEEDESFDVSPEELRKHLQSMPIYIFTSLAGGMQIIQKTNRLATILQGNGIKFEYRDLGTDEEAKKIWRRYAQGKTLPGVVRGDDFIGNWQYIDEVNEDYRLHEVLYETL